MKLTGSQIICKITDKLQFDMGRHLYGVMGTYSQLERFQNNDLAHAKDRQGKRLPTPINVNKELLARIGDDDLRKLIKTEGRRPQAVQRRLNQEFDRFLHEHLENANFLIIQYLELLFAYSLDLSVLRTRASNQNHILLLLPSEKRGDRLILFHEAEARFHRTLPNNLIADNHLRELSDG